MKFVKAFLLPLLFSAMTQAQDPVINLEFESEQGTLQVLIGERLSRDPETGAVSLFGGVQIRQENGGVLIADEAHAMPNLSDGDGAVRDLRQLETLTLRGRVFAKYSDLEIQSETLSFTDSLRFFSSLGGRVDIYFAAQSFEAHDGMIGDMVQETFYGFGKAKIQTEAFVLEGEHIQITLPNAENQLSYPLILAEGHIQLRGGGNAIFADQIQSSPDGQRLYLIGNVSIDSSAGTLEAGAVQFDLSSQEFLLNSASPLPTPQQEFLSL